MHTIGNVASQSANVSLAAYCLQLPGQKLHLSVLLAAKTFWGRGNKEAALAAFHELEAAGLGHLKLQESRRGTSAVSIILNVLVFLLFSITETCSIKIFTSLLLHTGVYFC